MKKNDYLNDTQSFIEWMSDNLDNGTFAHSYENRRTGNSWSCNSLVDAYRKYDWPHPAIPRLEVDEGTSFNSNVCALRALKEDLDNSVSPTGTDDMACEASIDVMRWGGVTNGNVRWLWANKSGLKATLQQVQAALDAGDTQDSRLNDQSLRFNAGMTKVYSLICNDFIIYDSRVAAALGWAVMKFCNDRQNIPTELKFPWAPAKEAQNASQPKQRYPGQEPGQFPRLQSGPMHAQWNLKASWLLKAVLDHPNARQSQFLQARNPLRALEAALFMIGYDLGGEGTGVNSTQPTSDVPSDTPDEFRESEEWTNCWTLKKKNPFRYRVSATGIEIKGGITFTVKEVNATLSNLRKEFAGEPFPLANSATKVREGTAPSGMGTAYFNATGKNPPNTSKLAAVLEDMQIIVPVTTSEKGMHWTLNQELQQTQSQQAVIDVTPVLREFLARQELL